MKSLKKKPATALLLNASLIATVPRVMNIMTLLISAMLFATNTAGAAASQGGEVIVVPGNKLHEICAQSGLVVHIGTHGKKECGAKPTTTTNYPPVPPNINPWERDPGSSSRRPTKRPTKKQCKNKKKSCSKKASEFVSQCIQSAKDFHKKELDAGRPCHGQSPEKLLEGINRYPSGYRFGKCTNSNYKKYPKCMKYYYSRGMDRCMYATPDISAGSSAGVKLNLNFRWGGFGVTHTAKVSTTFGGHEGSISSCQKAGFKANQVCEKSHKKCLKRAEK